MYIHTYVSLPLHGAQPKLANVDTRSGSGPFGSASGSGRFRN